MPLFAPAPPTVRVGEYSVGPATPADEPGIRALLREPMGGQIRISLEREPDARLAAAIEGDSHFAIVVKDGGGRVVGTGSRAVRTVWLNGAPARLGYLAQMRRHPSVTRSVVPLLRTGYALFAAARASDELPFNLSSIAADNGTARRLLERGLRGIPPYRPLGELVTCLLPTRGGPLGRFPGSGFRGRTGALPEILPAAERLEEAVACLDRNLSRHELAPVWTTADLAGGPRCRGLRTEDVWIATAADGRVRGCAALWDQRAFKQTRIRGYAPPFGRARPLLNAFLRLAGQPLLPPIGSQLSMAYLSHVAVDGDDPGTFLALVERARATARARGIDWLVVGFAEGHPFLKPLVRTRRPRTYRTILYAVEWTPEATPPTLDGQRLHVEVATL